MNFIIEDTEIPEAIPRSQQTFKITECCVPFCQTTEMETAPFDTTSIKCFRCKNFTCKSCTDQIWKGHWIGEEHTKPNIDYLLGMTHQIWKCPHCRSSFDRFI